MEEVPTTTASAPALPPGMFPLKALVSALVGQTNAELASLADTLPSNSMKDRKAALLKFSLHWRQQWIKLLVLVKWVRKVGDLSQLMNIIAFLESQDLCFSGAADALFKIHGEMLMAREPNYDVVTAVDILSAGNFQRLPTIIKKSTIPPAPLTKAQIEEALARLEDSIRMRLLAVDVIPSPFRQNMLIDRGCVTFRVENKFQVTLSLDASVPNLPWKIIDLKMLLNFVKEDYEGVIGINDYQLQGILNSAAESLLAPTASVPATEAVATVAFSTPPSDQPTQVASTNTPHYPLVSLYNHVNHLVARLQLEILHTQVVHLARSRWSGHINFESPSNESGTILKIRYWIGTSTGSTTGLRMHFLEIKLSTAPQQNTKSLTLIHSNTFSGSSSTHTTRPLTIRTYSILHTPDTPNPGPEEPLLNPTTNSPYEFTLDTSKLDVESLLVQVTYAQARNLILDLKKSLSSQFARVDVVEGNSATREDPSVTCFYRGERELTVSVDTRTGRLRVAEGASAFSRDASETHKIEEAVVQAGVDGLGKVITDLKFGTYVEDIKSIVGTGRCGEGVKFMETLPFEEALLGKVCKPKVPEHVAVLKFSEWDHAFLVLAVGDFEELRGMGTEGTGGGPLYRAWIAVASDGSVNNSSILKASIPVKRDNIITFLNMQRGAPTPFSEERSKRRKKTPDSDEHGVVEAQNDAGHPVLWNEMNADVLAIILAYARKQFSWLTILSQIDDLALDYDIALPREYANTPLSPEKMALIDTTIMIHPFFFDIERKIQYKSDLNLDRAATEEDKTAKYCFGNLYISREVDATTGISRVLGRVRLNAVILPSVVATEVVMDSPLATYDSERNVITFRAPESESGAKEILRHWKGLAAIAEAACQVWTRQESFKKLGIEIVSYAVGTLTLRVSGWGLLKNDADGNVHLRLRWRRFVNDVEGEAGARGLDQFVLDLPDEDVVDESVTKWLLVLQNVLNDCLDMVVFAKRLHSITSVMAVLKPIETQLNKAENRINGEPVMKVIPRSLSWIRVVNGTSGLDLYLFSNDTIIMYDASFGSADGVIDPKLVEILYFAQGNNSLVSLIPEMLRSQGITDVHLKSLSHGLLFSVNGADKILPIVLKRMDVRSVLDWLQNQPALVPGLQVKAELTQGIVKYLGMERDAGWKFSAEGWAFALSSKNPANPPIQPISNYLKMKAGEIPPTLINCRPVLQSFIHFAAFPQPVINEFIQVFVDMANGDNAVRVTLCFWMPPAPENVTRDEHLPSPGSPCFTVNHTTGQVSMVFWIVKRDGTGSRILPLRYNYHTKIKCIWKADPNPLDLTGEPIITESVKQELARQSMEVGPPNSVDAILAKLSNVAKADKLPMFTKSLSSKYNQYSAFLKE